MKKALNILFILIVGFTSCKKDTTSSTNSTPTPFTLKYEIKSSVPIVVAGAGTNNFNIIYYKNGTNQNESSIFTSGTNWTKTITVTTNNRPFIASLQLPNNIQLSAPGTLTGNIYLNGSLIANSINQSINTPSLNLYQAILVMSYPIQ